MRCYVCREEVLSDRKHDHHPHFDTNHSTPCNGRLTTWKMLDAVLQRHRNTFPAEAIMPP